MLSSRTHRNNFWDEPQTRAPRLTLASLTRRWQQLSPWLLVAVVGMALGASVLATSLVPQPWGFLITASVLCPFIAMAVGNVRKFFLAVILIEIPLVLDVHLGYREALGDLGAIGGLNISVTLLSLCVLYGLWFMRLLAKVESPDTRIFRQSLPLIVFVLAMSVSALLAPDITVASFEVALLAQSLLLFIYLLYAVQTRQDLLFVVTMLLVGLVMQSLIIFGTWATGISLELGVISAPATTIYGSRMVGTFGSPNAVAGYLTLILGVALGVLVARVPWHLKCLAAVAFGLGGGALFLTQSRGGWAAFLVTLVVLLPLAWYQGKTPLRVRMTFIAFLVSLIVGALIWEGLGARLFADDGGAAYSRIPLMRLASHIISDYPIFGAGTNNLVLVLDDYLTPEFAREWIYTVHNRYLLIWAEAGLGALAAFLWFLLAALKQGWYSWRHGNHLLSPLALGCSAAVLGHMVHLFVDIFNARPNVQMLWIVVGLIIVMFRMSRQKRNAEPNTL